MNVITGLPRAGTTLMCNILSQNVAFAVKSTSGLCEILATISMKISSMEEITNEMIVNEGFRDTLKDAMQSYSVIFNESDKTIFNKSRGWATNYLMYKELFPQGKAIVMVRDPRWVFNSIEKQHRKTAIFDGASNAYEKSLVSRAENLFANTGMIGMSINAVEDLIRRKQNPMVIKYEDFVKQPEFQMREVYKNLGYDYFEHNFDDVENTSTDVDAITRHKFPHAGSGKVEHKEEELLFNEEFGQQILNRFPLYCKTFGYN